LHCVNQQIQEHCFDDSALFTEADLLTIQEAIAVYEVLDAEIEEIRALKLQTQPEFEGGLEHYKNGDLYQFSKFTLHIRRLWRRQRNTNLF
jgi:hypothetical protein